MNKYAEGGIAQLPVKKFAVGGAAGTTTPASDTTTSSTLSPWAGEYVTGMLGKGQALAEQPYQAYTGQLTAGVSPLQTQAFNTASNLTTPTGIASAGNTLGDIAGKAQNLSYTPVTSSFDTTAAQQYMNPYIQNVLDKQLQIQNQQKSLHLAHKSYLSLQFQQNNTISWPFLRAWLLSRIAHLKHLVSSLRKSVFLTIRIPKSLEMHMNTCFQSWLHRGMRGNSEHLDTSLILLLT